MTPKRVLWGVCLVLFLPCYLVGGMLAGMHMAFVNLWLRDFRHLWGD